MGAIDIGLFRENAWHDTCHMIKLHKCFCDISAHIILLNAVGYGAECSAAGFCAEKRLLLWHRLSWSMNEGIRSDVSPTWQRQRRVQLIRSHFNFISVYINSLRMAVTLGERWGRKPRFSDNVWGQRERENKEDICPLGYTDTIFDTFP